LITNKLIKGKNKNEYYFIRNINIDIQIKICCNNRQFFTTINVRNNKNNEHKKDKILNIIENTINPSNY
jgi:hypothetical protein